MLKQSVRVIGIMLKYARLTTIIKLIQLLASALLTPLSIYFTQRLIDNIEPYINGRTTIEPLLLYGGLLLVSMFFVSTGGFFDSLLFIRIKHNLNQHLTPVVVGKFRRLDYACFEDNDTHDTIKRMSGTPQDNILNIFLNVTGVATIFITIIGSAVVFAQIGIWFMVGFLVLLLPMVWIDFKSANMMNAMFDKQSTDERRMHYYGNLLSDKASLYELRVFGSAGYILDKWRGITKTVLNERLRTTIKAQKQFLISTVLFKTWSFFIVFSLVYAIISGNVSIGLFAALIASTGTVLSSTESLSHSLDNVMRRILMIKHFDNFMSLPEIPDIQSGKKIQSPHIVFENVTFTYPKTDKHILNGVSFEIKPGERIALVGENGAGKSTIIKLLCRLYTPDSGRILINGTDIAELSQAQLRDVYSVVFQDFGSYHLMLRENVAFGAIGKLHDDNAIKTAMKQGLASGIGDNLDMHLGKLTEDGVDLSGGQWQRIAIARACIADSAFVILDEPTASLDPVAESEVYHSFAEVMKNKGAILISHRLASARICDRIIVLADGVVKESGSHDGLVNAGGRYARMWAAQSEWYKGGEQNG